ncbi:MAG: fasciclin domain-containing protein [Myxococcales bacterium]|nr:fasciclin domain-containing protein [Myxococcales bacterium]
MNLAVRSIVASSLAVALFACSDSGTSDPAPAPTATATATATATTAPTTPPPAQLTNIVDTAVGAGSFKTLAAALTAAGLVDTLKGPGPFTVFAPTDEAFAKLPAGTVEALLKPENKAALTSILTYHVVSGNVKAADVTKLAYAETIQGGDLRIKVSGSDVLINDTIKVVKTDILASNGVIHVLDAVLASPPKDIVETATAAGSFKTLVAAVGAAGLSETLKGKGPFTVFAPTDAAFAKLPAGTVENLLVPANKAQLVDILKYHVVAGKVRSDKVVGLTSAQTLLPMNTVAIKVEGASVLLNTTTKVTSVDVDASNGVIHVIDSVLLPSK